MFCEKCGQRLEPGSSFCTNCGAKVSSASESNAETENAASEGTAQAQEAIYSQKETPDLSGAPEDSTSSHMSAAHSPADPVNTTRQIIGKRADYYLTQFGQMQQGAKSKMNWASFFLSLLHASYRNMWHEWLRAVRVPLIIGICMWILGGILLFWQPIAGLLLLLAALAVGIWQIVAQILFAKHFNMIYMQHVEKKLAQNDCTPDPSGVRVVVAYLVSMGVGAVIGTILSVTMLGGMLTALSSLDDTYYEDMLPDESIVEPASPQEPEAGNVTALNAAAVNLNSYTGSWDVDRYNSYMDGYVDFTIENVNDQFYFSANGVWNQGNRVNNIDFAQIELNYEGTQAGGYYEDGRGNYGDVILDFESGELYLTITAQGSGDYSFSMEHEHCTRDQSSAQNSPMDTSDTPQIIDNYWERATEVNCTATVSSLDGLGVNLRSGPDSSYETVRDNPIPDGTVLAITYQTTSLKNSWWGYTEYDGVSGWVYLDELFLHAQGSDYSW